MEDLGMFTTLIEKYGLFTALVCYVLYDSRNREQRYISVIDKLSDAFTDIKNDVEHIKNKLGV